jgi:hypothetical protein
VAHEVHGIGEAFLARGLGCEPVLRDALELGQRLRQGLARQDLEAATLAQHP